MTLAEIDVENSVAMHLRTKMRTTAFHAKMSASGDGRSWCRVL
jgi:hypothetical protein